MQVRGEVVTHQSEEGDNSDSFVAISGDFEIYGMSVICVGEEGNEGVDGNHEQYTDNAVYCQI
jgi:hypothetical protein